MRDTGDRGRRLDEIPVLFIAGAPRSGSTLLERVVGSRADFCSVGELHFVWERSYLEDQLCGCGNPFSECGFWSEVSRVAYGERFGAAGAADALALKALASAKRHVPWLIAPVRPAAYEARLRRYGDVLERLYEAILKVSGAEVIVDSSKDPRHGLILASRPRLRVHVVHLIRDPRAVAFSWRRHKQRPEIHWKRQEMPVERISMSALRWTRDNALVEALSVRAASSCRVRYEDFVSRPEAALARVLAPYGDGRELPAAMPSMLGPAHTVAGNPIRFQQGPLRIRADEEWRGAMRRRDRALVEAITWPLLAAYGYELGGRASEVNGIPPAPWQPGPAGRPSAPGSDPSATAPAPPSA